MAPTAIPDHRLIKNKFGGHQVSDKSTQSQSFFTGAADSRAAFGSVHKNRYVSRLRVMHSSPLTG